MKKIYYFIFILLFINVGCTMKNDVSENNVKVIPSKLFEGKAKKLESHFDMITGNIKVKYHGKKDNICLKYELWENGKIKELQNVTSTFIDKNEFDGEITILLMDRLGADFKKSDSMILKSFIGDDEGYGGGAQSINRFEKDWGYGLVELKDELKVSDSEEITVWGLIAKEGSFAIGGKSIEDEVKSAGWGLVLKIYFK
ncbi:hypothetical protein [Oceanirhabdus sp. W0125-5]|uniref:hypothetical protein n=1 Tax=Oceanirhabdus sp. W0125-5 TaxID=2999116 RepID=UPI0022F2DD81|nr:hypothetical protein [Oceanirhabdus sp. W0125-5]WBW95854.1 hypothetical protein OW730_19500 [Oceanirhabdus sp. W0125-5]